MMDLNSVVVRLLDEDDARQVEILDDLSENWVSDFIEDNTDYAYGAFKGEELIGYCTIGYADDCNSTIKNYPGYTQDSLLLSDVFIKDEYRGQGIGAKMVDEAVKYRTQYEKELVFLTILQDELSKFYEKLGFELIGEDAGSMVRTEGVKGMELNKEIAQGKDLLGSPETVATLDDPTKGLDWCYNRPVNKEIIRVYFNPNSNAGGQYVEDHIKYNLILEAKENSRNIEDFFNIIDSRCTQYLIDIGTPEFEAYVGHLKRNTPDFIGGLDEGAMDKLVDVANKGLAIEQAPEVDKYGATIELAERIDKFLCKNEPFRGFGNIGNYNEDRHINIAEIVTWIIAGDKKELAGLSCKLSEIKEGYVLDTMKNQQKFTNELREVNDLLYSLDNLDQYMEYYGRSSAPNSKYAIQEFRNLTLKILEGDQIPGKDISTNGHGIGFANRRALYYAVKNFEEINNIPEEERVIRNDSYEDKELLYEAYDRYVGMSHQNDLAIQPYLKQIPNNPHSSPLSMIAEIYYAQQNGLSSKQISYALDCVKDEAFPAESFRSLRYGFEKGFSIDMLDVIKGESLMTKELLLEHMVSGGTIDTAKALKGCDIAQYYLISGPLKNGDISCDMASNLIKSINDVASHAQLDMLNKEFLTEFCVREVLSEDRITPQNVERAAQAFMEQTDIKDFCDFITSEGGFREVKTKSISEHRNAANMERWSEEPWFRLQEESPMREWNRHKKYREDKTLDDDLSR